MQLSIFIVVSYLYIAKYKQIIKSSSVSYSGLPWYKIAAKK